MAELLGGGSFVALSHKRRWICLCKRHAGRQSCRLVSASTSCVPQLPWRPPAGRPPRLWHRQSVWLPEGSLSVCRVGRKSPSREPWSRPQAEREDSWQVRPPASAPSGGPLLGRAPRSPHPRPAGSLRNHGVLGVLLVRFPPSLSPRASWSLLANKAPAPNSCLGVASGDVGT